MDEAKTHPVAQAIIDALAVLKDNADSDESPRDKAMVKTHLEDALLRAECIYYPLDKVVS